MEVFKDYAYYYNAFYQDKDYRAEALQVDSLLKNMGKILIKSLIMGAEPEDTILNLPDWDISVQELI